MENILNDNTTWGVEAAKLNTNFKEVDDKFEINVLSPYSIDILNFNTSEHYMYLDSGQVQLASSSNYKTTNPLKVDPNSSYTIDTDTIATSGLPLLFASCDKNGNFDNKIAVSISSGNRTLNVPEDVEFIRFSFHADTTKFSISKIKQVEWNKIEGETSYFNRNGYINTTGEFVSQSSYRCTDYIILSAQIKVENLNQGESQVAIAFFDKEFNFISANSTTNGVVEEIPNNAMYAIFSTTLAKSATAYFYLQGKDKVDVAFSEYVNESIIEQAKQFKTGEINLDGLNFSISGYLNTTGEFVSQAAYRATDYILILGLSNIDFVKLNEGGSAKAIVFYDKDKLFLSYASLSSGNGISGSFSNIPENAMYVRFTCTAANLEVVQVNLTIGAINTNELFKTVFDNVDSLSKNIRNISAIKTLPKNVLVAGSSITWGHGDLNDKQDSGTGYWLEQLLNSISNTVYFDEVSTVGTQEAFTNQKLVRNQALKISGVGAKISFPFYCDEINICQAILRTNNYADVIVRADGNQILSFHNKNKTYKTTIQETFIGDGETANFQLSHPYTFNHSLTVAGVAKNVVVHTGGYSAGYEWGESAPYNAVIVRAWNSAEERVVHELRFKEGDVPANEDSIVITYDKGKVIFYEKSTVGQLTNDSSNESNYGVGGTQYDPLNPTSISSGMEYRSVDNDAFQSFKFSDGMKQRNIEIEIVGGVNPYFIFNFATVRKHILTNAAIGGWSLSHYIDDSPTFNMDVLHFLKYGKPDVLFFQPGLGDDSKYKERKVKRTVENETEGTALSVCTRGEVDLITYVSPDNYTIRYCTGYVTAITPYSLVSSEITGTDVTEGDIVRIGTYYGDNRQVVVREIKTVNLTTGEITWVEPLIPENILNIDKLSDLVGAEISVRDLSGWYDNLKTFIQRLQSMSPDTLIALVTSENSNYYYRQSWGYETMIRKASLEFNNIKVVNTGEWFQKVVNSWVTGTVFQEIESTGVNEYELSHAGMWQGYKVIVDGEDLYGRNAVVKMGFRRGVDQSLTGSDISITGAYQGVNIAEQNRLIFLSDAPAVGKTIRIERASRVFGSDLTHPNEYGAEMYGQLYADVIKSL